MRSISKHWPRITVTLLPLVLALLHSIGVLHLEVLQKLDDIIYDARLTATAPLEGPLSRLDGQCMDGDRNARPEISVY